MNGPSKAIDRHKAAVSSLFFGCSPAAVAWFIALAVVDAVKLVTRSGFPTKFGKEYRVIVPNNGKFYSTSAVVFPILIARSTTSIARCGPRFIFCCFVAFTMRCISLFDAFYAKTSARLSVTILKIMSIENLFSSAIATAKPATVAFVNVVERKDKQATKSVAREVYDLIFAFWHPPIMTYGDCFVHSI
jgi:hypothetical protein